MRLVYREGKTYRLEEKQHVKQLKDLLKKDREQLLPIVHDVKADKARAIKKASQRYIENMSGYEITKE